VQARQNGGVIVGYERWKQRSAKILASFSSIGKGRKKELGLVCKSAGNQFVLKPLIE